MLIKKYISILLMVLCFCCVPVSAADGVPEAPTSSELSVTAPESAAEVTSLNGLDLTKNGVTFSVEQNYVEYEYVSLSNDIGCYQFSRKSGTSGGTAYFMNGSDFAVSANRNYKLSALVYCDFDRTDCEVNLGFRVCNENGNVTLIDAFHGLPAKTDGWYRFETVLTTPFDASTARFYGVMFGFDDADDGAFYIADLDMWELAAEELEPISEGAALSFDGSSGMYEMKVLTPENSASAVVVKTNGAEYRFDKQNSKITVKQRIGNARELAVLELENKSLASLTVYSSSDKEAILTTGEDGISFGIQMDGLMLISPQGEDAQIKITSKIDGAWNRLLCGNLLVMDDVGGFTVNPAIPLGTGRVPRYVAGSGIDFENKRQDTTFISDSKAGWDITYTVSSGERLGVTAFPPREYDWENSFDSIYANMDYGHQLGTGLWSNYKSQHGVKYGVMDHCEKAWGMSYGTTYTPRDEEDLKAQVEAAKAAEMVPMEYMSMYFWDGTLDEYITEVTRHKTEYGIEGVYTDGLPPLDWLEAYEGVRRLREVFPNGCIIAHTTGQIANGGPPTASPEIFIPAIDAYCTMTLRGEQVTGYGKDWNYPRFVTSAYGASNAIGLIKGDSWQTSEGAAVSQKEQDLISLLYNGRARKATHDMTEYREVLGKLEKNWLTSGWSDEYYDVCYLPYARRLIREKISDFPTSTLISEEFSADGEFTQAPNTATIDSGRLKLSSLAKTQIDFLPSYGKTEISLTFTFDELSQAGIDITDGKGNVAISLSQSGDRLRYLHRKGGYLDICGITAGESTKLKLVADPAAGSFNLLLGETILLENEPFAKRTSELSNVAIRNNGTEAAFADNLVVKSGL